MEKCHTRHNILPILLKLLIGAPSGFLARRDYANIPDHFIPDINEIAMSQLMRFPSSVKRDPAIEVWMHKHAGQLGAIARRWFEVMRACGDDVRELLHDGHPTACVADAAFGYVNAFKDHVNVGFFRGAEIADPHGILEGTVKVMRHVKLRPEQDVDAAALSKLIEAAYNDMKGRVEAEASLTNR